MNRWILLAICCLCSICSAGDGVTSATEDSEEGFFGHYSPSTYFSETPFPLRVMSAGEWEEFEALIRKGVSYVQKHETSDRPIATESRFYQALVLNRPAAKHMATTTMLFTRDIGQFLDDQKTSVTRRARAFVEGAMVGDISVVSDYLRRGHDPNVKSMGGFTALQNAVGSGDPEMVELLLLHKADSRILDPYGRSLIETAIARDHRTVVETLMRHPGMTLTAVETEMARKYLEKKQREAAAISELVEKTTSASPGE